jgi:hypothetical protein
VLSRLPSSKKSYSVQAPKVAVGVGERVRVGVRVMVGVWVDVPGVGYVLQPGNWTPESV